MRNKTTQRSIFAIIIISLVAVWGWWYFLSLPEILFSPPYAYLLLDKNQALLNARIADDEQWRFPVIDRLPEKYTTALIQFEDKRFWRHQGVDFLALLRASYNNLSRGKITSGASTLSMQVIRLSRNNPKRSFDEKITEFFRAWRLESRFSKKEILQMYASHAPYGGNVVGLEAAAWRYFGRAPNQLSWAESAMLAVLPNHPALVHPGRQRPLLLKKRNRLLKKMQQKDLLTKLEYQLAIAEPLPKAPHPLPQLAPHLLDTLVIRYPGGKSFYSTLDIHLQQQANAIAHHAGKQLALEGVKNLAIVVLHNPTFDILAYVGNRPGQSVHADGHAIDMVQRPRSTASTLKPFLLAFMINSGQILPDSLVADVPINYSGFSPKNYNRTYHGAVSAKTALIRSLNIPLVNMLSDYGVTPFLMQLRQLGFQQLNQSARHYGLSLILGGAEATLWELANAYANLANLALQTADSQHIYWQQGRVLQQDVAESPRLATLSTATAWLTLESMLEVVRPNEEGYWKKFSSSRKAAWKTGTSYGQRDAWAIGVTPEYTIGVWAGNADGESAPTLTGTKTAAPILFRVLNILPQQHRWFTPPDWQMKTLKVCKNDAYLSNGNCDTQSVKIPVNSHFSRITPNHQRIYLDESGQWRVHSQCEPVYKMQAKNWFVLPPDQAHYYQQHHADYRPLPAFRPDCNKQNLSTNPLTLVYPKNHSQIYLPRELDGKLGQVVFRAIPQQKNSLLYWHLDQQFIGSTQDFHQQAVQPKPGKHQLTVVDENGHRVSVEFEVLNSP